MGPTRTLWKWCRNNFLPPWQWIASILGHQFVIRMKIHACSRQTARNAFPATLLHSSPGCYKSSYFAALPAKTFSSFPRSASSFSLSSTLRIRLHTFPPFYARKFLLPRLVMHGSWTIRIARISKLTRNRLEESLSLPKETFPYESVEALNERRGTWTAKADALLALSST